MRSSRADRVGLTPWRGGPRVRWDSSPWRVSPLSVTTAGPPSSVLPDTKPPFRPRPVADFASAGLNLAQVESLVLKFLMNVGTASGRRIAEEMGLPFGAF